MGYRTGGGTGDLAYYSPMPRGAEVVRQWTILQAIDGAPQGLSVAALAKRTGVHKRTVWRDLAALQEAGFPLYDETRTGETIWKLNTNGADFAPEFLHDNVRVTA